MRLVDCEFGSRKLNIESSVVVACEGWLFSTGSSEMANASKGAELCRLRRSLASNKAVEILGCRSVLPVDFPALSDDVSGISSTNCDFSCAFCSLSSTLHVSWIVFSHVKMLRKWACS